jgi:hypothetical protein
MFAVGVVVRKRVDVFAWGGRLEVEIEVDGIGSHARVT